MSFFTLNLSHAPELETQWLDMKSRGQEVEFFAEQGANPEVQAAFFAEDSVALPGLVERILSKPFPAVDEVALSALFALLDLGESADTSVVHEGYREKVLNQPGLLDYLGGVLAVETIAIESQRYAAGILKLLAFSGARGRAEIMGREGLLKSFLRLVSLNLEGEPASKMRIEVLKALSNLGYGCPENKSRLIQFPGFMAALVNLLDSGSVCVEEKTTVAMVFKNWICGHPENGRLLGRNDRVIPGLISLISLGSLEASAVRARIEALRALEVFATNSENQTRLAEFPGFIEVLVDILLRDSANFKEKEAVVRVLNHLMVSHPANRVLLGANNRVLQSLVKLLMSDSTEPSAEEARKCALSALRHITEHPANRGKVQLTFDFIEPAVKSLYAGAPLSSLSARMQAVGLISFFMAAHPGNKKYIETDERLISGLIDQLSDNSEATLLLSFLVASKESTLLAYLVKHPEVLTRFIDALLSALQSDQKSQKVLNNQANVAGILVRLVGHSPESRAYMVDNSQVLMLAILRLFQRNLSPTHKSNALKLFVALDLGFDRLKEFFVLGGCLSFSKANLAGFFAFGLTYGHVVGAPAIFDTARLNRLIPSEKMIEFLVFSLLRETDPEEASDLMESVKKFAASPAWRPQFQAFPPARFLVSHFADESSTPEKQAFAQTLAALGILPDASLRETRFAFLAKTLFPECVNQQAESPVSAEGVASVPSLAPSPLLCTVMRDAVRMMAIPRESAGVIPGEETSESSHQVVSEYAMMVSQFL